MPIKTVAAYASDVANMGFDEIKKDRELLNAVSKALTKGYMKENFNYLNDRKRDADHLYERYVKDNDVNIASSLKKEFEEAMKANDKSKTKQLLAKIDDEVNRLFKTNLRSRIIDDVSFKTWVDLQNEPEIKKMATRNAATAGKKLGIKDTDALAKAIAAMMRGDKDEALKALARLDANEKAADLLKALEKAGLA